MNIRDTITTINELQAAGVIGSYAIGGAVGATFYLEPITTLDVDVFVAFRTEPGQLVSLRPIYDYLTARGCVVEGEYVVIAGWPVQFLPAGSSLVEEAIDQAVEHNVDGTPVRVFTSEHLAAIALQVGRAKDKARLLQFNEAGALDADRFQSIIQRHKLVDHWRRFERQFLGDQP